MKGLIWLYVVLSCLSQQGSNGTELDKSNVEELIRLVESSREARLKAILRLRDIGDERAIPVLSRVLDKSRGYNSAWRFAAVQALCCIGTDTAHELLKENVLSLDYALDASVQCAFEWGMNAAKRDQFIARYHLQNISTNLSMSLKVEPLKKAGRSVFAFEVAVCNTSDRPVKVLRPEDHFGKLVLLATMDGHFVERVEARHSAWHKPVWRELKPGRILRIRFQGLLQRRADLSGVLPRSRYRSPGTLGLDFGETIHIIDLPGKMLVQGYFFLAGESRYTALMWAGGKPRKKLAFESATASAGRFLNIVELTHVVEEDPDMWVGRIVSRPVVIDLSSERANDRPDVTERFAPRDPQEVELLWDKPQEDYVVIGHFHSRGDSPKSIRKRAARIGADAVIVTPLAGESVKVDTPSRMPQLSRPYSRIVGEAIRYK